MQWLKSHGWLNEIEVGDAMYENSYGVDAEEGGQVAGDRDGQKEFFLPAEGRPMEAYQPQLPLQMPFLGAGNEPPTLDTLHETSIPTARPAPATTMQHWALNTLIYPQTPPSMQLPMQAPQATYRNSNAPLSRTCNHESYDRESENSTGTTPDEEMILNMANISRVARLEGHWFVDVDYEESLFPREYFGQILFANFALSGLAETARFHHGQCRVQWRSETIPLARARLRSDYTDLVRRLDVLCPAQGIVEWHARDSTYVFQGSNERHRLCLGNRCQSCASLGSIVATMPP